MNLMNIDTRITGPLGAMHVCRDENGSVATDCVYTDAELAAMPIPLRNEYLDAVEGDELKTQNKIDFYGWSAGL